MQKSKLIQSREAWREKAQQRRMENKSLHKSLSVSRKSRDHWQAQFLFLEQQMERLKEELAAEKKRREELKLSSD